MKRLSLVVGCALIGGVASSLIGFEEGVVLGVALSCVGYAFLPESGR